MGRLFTLIGYFLIGVSAVGLFSFTAATFPSMRAYGFWLSVIVGLVMVGLALGDDYFAPMLGLNYYQYVGLMISIALILIVGSLIQWVR